MKWCSVNELSKATCVFCLTFMTKAVSDFCLIIVLKALQ